MKVFKKFLTFFLVFLFFSVDLFGARDYMRGKKKQLKEGYKSSVERQKAGDTRKVSLKQKTIAIGSGVKGIVKPKKEVPTDISTKREIGFEFEKAPTYEEAMKGPSYKEVLTQKTIGAAEKSIELTKERDEIQKNIDKLDDQMKELTKKAEKAGGKASKEDLEGIIKLDENRKLLEGRLEDVQKSLEDTTGILEKLKSSETGGVTEVKGEAEKTGPSTKAKVGFAATLGGLGGAGVATGLAAGAGAAFTVAAGGLTGVAVGSQVAPPVSSQVASVVSGSQSEKPLIEEISVDEEEYELPTEDLEREVKKWDSQDVDEGIKDALSESDDDYFVPEEISGLTEKQLDERIQKAISEE